MRRKDTGRLDVPDDISTALLLHLHPLLLASSHATNMIATLMLSCYLQGALDAAMLPAVTGAADDRP